MIHLFLNLIRFAFTFDALRMVFENTLLNLCFPVVSLPTGLTAPPTVRIVHSGLACNIEEERYSERVYTIREGETLELTCLVTGHPRPQVSPE